MSLTKNFPVSNVGESPRRPKVVPEDWKVQLVGGREIFLTRIQQHLTYGGLLSGLPQDPEGIVIRAIEEAKEWDNHFHGEPIVISASIVRGMRSAPSNPQFGPVEAMSWSMLPQVATFAEFNSRTTVHGDGEAYSSALIVWWQGQFGLPSDPDLLSRLRSIEWMQCAKDWTP